MREVTITPATGDNVEDLAYVAQHMRTADIAEVWALSRLSPRAALDVSVSLTTYPYIAYCSNRPAAVFGVFGSFLGDVGVPWFLGTDDVKRHAGELLRHTRPFLRHQFVKYRRLENEVHAANRDAVRFLKWAGFTFEQPHTNYAGAEVIRFWMER